MQKVVAISGSYSAFAVVFRRADSRGCGVHEGLSAKSIVVFAQNKAEAMRKTEMKYGGLSTFHRGIAGVVRLRDVAIVKADE